MRPGSSRDKFRLWSNMGKCCPSVPCMWSWLKVIATQGEEGEDAKWEGHPNRAEALLRMQLDRAPGRAGRGLRGDVVRCEFFVSVHLILKCLH